MGRAIIGVLDGPPGARGSTRGWTFVLHLMPWTDGATLGARPLRVEIPGLDDAALHRAMHLNGHDVVRIPLSRFKDKTLAYGRLPITKVKPSKSLFAAARDRQKPVVQKDKRLGRLVLDRSLNSFVGRTRLWGARTEVSVQRSTDRDDPARDARDVNTAAAQLAGLEKRRAELIAAIVQKMLPLYNNTWREDGDRELGKAAFVKKLAVESVGLTRSRVTLYIDCAGLFTDHVIEVRIAASGRISEIHLAG